MSNQIQLFKWGTDYLVSNGYFMERQPEIVVATPWSTVIRFATSTGNIFLKQTPPATYFSSEVKIIQILSKQFHANVPFIIACNDNLHCFLMEDAGHPLRELLKKQFRLDLLCQAVKQYAAILRATENHTEIFIKLGIPDWRLDKLPTLYDQIIKQIDFLKTEGLTDKELQTLHKLSPQFLAQCKLLSSYGIPETIGYHDFHDNNVIIDQNTNKMTFADWSETAIIHPFFSLYNCLQQSTKHYGVQEDDQNYQKLQDACFENWLGLMPKDQLLDVFILSKQLWPIYCVLSSYQCMLNVDLKTHKAYYTNNTSQIVKSFREYIESFKNGRDERI